MAQRFILSDEELKQKTWQLVESLCREDLNRRLVIGIDTGLAGGIAFMPIGGSAQPFAIPMPVVKHLGKRVKKKGKKTKPAGRSDYDDRAICKIFQRFGPACDRIVVGVEQTQPQGGGRQDTAMTAYSMGGGFRMWPLFLTSLGMSLERIRPQAWLKHFSLIGTDKASHVQKARDIWPSLNQYFALKVDEGRAEAMLIAEATRRIRQIEI